MRKVLKPTAIVGVLAAMAFIAADIFDGANERVNQRVSQVRETVVNPAEDTMSKVQELASKLWASIEANPGPSILALSLFAFTVIYHKMKGHSTVAALKAGLLKETPEPTLNPILVKAQAQAIETQMYEMHDRLEARSKVLPQEIKAARQSVDRATSAHDKAVSAAQNASLALMREQGYLDRLLKEQEETEETLKQLDAELNKA